jgi:hypothetical protein
LILKIKKERKKLSLQFTAPALKEISGRDVMISGCKWSSPRRLSATRCPKPSLFWGKGTVVLPLISYATRKKSCKVLSWIRVRRMLTTAGQHGQSTGSPAPLCPLNGICLSDIPVTTGTGRSEQPRSADECLSMNLKFDPLHRPCPRKFCHSTELKGQHVF